jgi:signal transduction histidine kinase
MERISRERDRLLRYTARLVALCTAGVALACVLLPGAVTPALYLPFGVAFALFFILTWITGSRELLLWIVGAMLSGIAAIVVLGSGPNDMNAATATAVIYLSGALASLSIVLLTGPLRITLLAIGFAGTASAALWALRGYADPFEIMGLLVLSWGMAIIAGAWISRSVPKAASRIQSLGRAHQAERRASETEAQRRQSARLLHDTVLATLTLLAHSGVGVAPAAMQQQAGDDARLLRQLRLGDTPRPSSSGDYNLEPVEESELGNTLESVKSRFHSMGLEVSWHGTGQVLLPRDVLDAFLLSLAECLENVRRHSGVREAHVTITDDPTTVRALVTDSGVGFDIEDVDTARLGLKESVMARLQEVGGTARLFSAPGAGTTVVLEVPR